jgi:DNA-binding beta-propeller fold protein YncE
MSFPMGLTVDRAGRLWVVDRENNRVLRFDNAASKPSGAAADGVLGQPDFVSSAADNTQGGMSYPTSVAADAAGRLWVADGRNDLIMRFDNAAGKPNGAAADGVLYGGNANDAWTFARPYGICVDAAGRLWVADTNNNRVVWFDNPASKPAAAVPDGVLGQPNFRSNEQQTSAEGMLGPLGLIANASGRLFVADGGNNRVLWFDNAADKPNGAPADGVWGQPDFTSRTADISGDSFDLPFALALDLGGQLWLADASNNRVLLFDPALTIMPRVYLPLLTRR